MSAWDDVGYDDSWGNGAPPPPYAGANDTNPAGSQADPFDYTSGSLLTPWRGHFNGSQFGNGGGGVAEYTPFNYADFSYNPSAPAGFDEKYADPGEFKYNDYTGPEAFRPTTAADMEADPGYQARQDAGRRALEASAAKGGVLRTGGTLKGLQRQGSEIASQEFGAVDARRNADYNRTADQGKYTYGVNRANNAENYDRNIKNQQTGYGIRQGAWKDNAANQQVSNAQGFQFATGAYDRNEAKARQGYEDAAAHAQAVASAGAAGANRSYERALDEYKMARDEFYTNQDRQYNILDREDVKGRAATGAQAAAEDEYGQRMAENAYQRGNVAAEGRAARGQASTNMWSNLGDVGADAAMYAYAAKSGTPARKPTAAVPGYRAAPAARPVPPGPR